MITFVAVSHNETYQAHGFLSSLVCQTDNRWKCIVFNNGPNPELKAIVEYYQQKFPSKFIYLESTTNTGAWGCYNRIEALKIIDSLYVINTSIQDYYIPIAVEEIMNTGINIARKKMKIPEADIVYFNCLHNHYQFRELACRLQHSKIDWGCFAIKPELMREVGIRLPEDSCADGIFIQDVVTHLIVKNEVNQMRTRDKLFDLIDIQEPILGTIYIPKILTIHN